MLTSSALSSLPAVGTVYRSVYHVHIPFHSSFITLGLMLSVVPLCTLTPHLLARAIQSDMNTVTGGTCVDMPCQTMAFPLPFRRYTKGWRS